MQWLSEGPKTTASTKVFGLALKPEIFLQKLLMMLCTVDYEIAKPLQFDAEEYCFCKYSQSFTHSFNRMDL